MNIRKWSYCDYKTNNYGAHATAIAIGDLTLYFSYDTVVAFEYEKQVRCTKNKWGVASARHLNAIEPDKSKRIDYDQLDNELRTILRKLGLTIL